MLYNWQSYFPHRYKLTSVILVMNIRTEEKSMRWFLIGEGGDYNKKRRSCNDPMWSFDRVIIKSYC